MVTTSVITRASMLENISYFKLGSLMLSYNFDGNWMKKAHISSLGLSFSVSNLFIITASDYLGYDPDNSTRLGDNNWGANRQFFSYPRPRTFTLGVNLTF